MARQQFDSLSVEQALLLQQMELASRDFVAARAADVAKSQTRLEIARVEQETAKQLASARRAEARIKKHDAELTKQPDKPNRKTSLKKVLLIVGFVAVIAGVGLLINQQLSQVDVTSTSCVQVSDISALTGSVACVEFTPQGSNTEYRTAYLNDLELYKDGVFYLEIPNWSAIYENASEITAMKGNLIRVTGLVSPGDGDRYKIVVTSTSQIQR